MNNKSVKLMLAMLQLAEIMHLRVMYCMCITFTITITNINLCK
jgi:hypothetical protein